MKKLLFSAFLFLVGTTAAQTEFDVIDGFTLEKVSSCTVSSTTKQAWFRNGGSYFTVENVSGPIWLTVESPGMKPLTITVTIDKQKSPGYLVLQPDEATLKKYHSQHAFYPIEEETKDTVKPSALPAVPSEPEQAEPQEEPEKEPEPAKEPASERDVVPEPVSVQSDMIYVEIDEQASFPGQTVSRFIMTNLRYPQKAIDYNIQGKVIVRFVVSTTGDITDVRIVKSMNLPMDQECVRIVQSMPRWSPGKHKGKPVNSWFNLPVSFKLQ